MNKKFYLLLFLAVLVISITTTYIGATTNIFLEQTPDFNEEEVLNKAKEEFYKGNLEKSKKLYLKIIKYNETPTALSNMALIEQELGQTGEAIKTYHKILDQNPDNERIKFNLGKLYLQKGNYTESEIYLKQIFNNLENINLSNKLKVITCFYLGKSSLKKNNLNQALKYFNKGIEINNKNPLNFLGKGEAYEKKGELKKAISNYTSALKRDYSISAIYSNLAQAYEQVGNNELAYNYWKESLVKGSKKEIARKRIKEIENKFPHITKKEEEEKRLKRNKINWQEIYSPPTGDDLPLLKIGLIDNAKKLTFQTSSSFNIYTSSNKILFKGKPNQEYNISINKNNYILTENDEKVLKKLPADHKLKIIPSNRDNLTIIYNVAYGQDYFWGGTEDRQYRGRIFLKPAGLDQFNIINHINITEYLFSVIPAEMPAYWPEEALKAQAVTARSYALKHLDRHQKSGYDLCDSVHCAAYNGVKSETTKTNKLIMATQGEVAKIDDKLIDAVFSSNSGGFTESSKDVWGNKFSYLKGRKTMTEESYDFPLSPSQLYNWLIENPPSFSDNKYTNKNSYRWIKLLSAEVIKDRYNLSEIKNIVARGRSKGGSIQEINIIGRDNKVTIKQDNIRSALGGLRSNRFFLERFFDQEGNIEELLIYGGGWGHNVGMDQNAAAGMAMEGYNYKEIIKYFYEGINIKKVY